MSGDPRNDGPVSRDQVPTWVDEGFRPGRWRPTHAHARAVLVGAGGLLLALLTGRPDLVLVVAPLVLVAVWGMLARPQGRPEGRLRLSRTVLGESEEGHVITEIRGLGGADTASSQVMPSPWTVRRPDHGARTVMAPGGKRGGLPEEGQDVRIITGVDPERWGVHRVGPAAAGALGPWGSWVWGPVPLDACTLRAVPDPDLFESSAPAPHPRGLIGRHRSVRPGEGAEFDTVRPFRWGDRLRRIHWARSSRSSELHVTASHADQDIHLALLLDAQEDLVPPCSSVTDQGGAAAPSSLDRAVRSTAAISEHFARAGDRVSLQVLPAGRLRQFGRVPPGTGIRQARRILDVLSHVSPAVERSPDLSRIRLGLTPGTLVVLVSALLSEAAVLRAAALVRSGLTVVIVDVLGDQAAAAPGASEGGPEAYVNGGDAAPLAWRLRMLERQDEVRRLRGAGVAVVPWRGPGSLDAVLRLLARRGTGAAPPGAGL